MNNLIVVASFLVCQTADVRLNDGSNLVVALKQSSLEVQTKYGKLVIPVSDLKKVEFGVHLKESEQKKLESCLSSLDSQSYKDRDSAQKEIFEIGPRIYGILKARKGESQESRNRIARIIADLEENFQADELSRLKYDLIHTRDFTFGGTVVGSIAVSSKTIGDHALELSTLRSLITHIKPSTITVPAPGPDPGEWFDTGMVLDGQIIIRAEGSIDIWPSEPGKYLVSPTGYTSTGRSSQFPAGALVAKVGSGSPFQVGSSYSGFLSGRLYLQIAPSPWNAASSGSFCVKVSQKP